MKLYQITAAFLLFAVQAFSQPKGSAEIQKVTFATEAFGFNSTVLNPAGLARRSNDDGAFLNYNTTKDGKKNETYFNFSMGNLAFGYQEFMPEGEINPLLKYYRLGLAIGGKVFAFGTSNKLIELEFPHHATHVFSMDAGFIFQPVSWFTFAGSGRDLDEPQLEDIQFTREYNSGFSFNLFHSQLRFLGQASWDDSVQYIENAKYKIGMAFSPIENSNIIIGGIQYPHAKKEFFAMLQIPIWQGINVTLSSRFNEKGVVQKYYAGIYIPLKTATL